MKHAYLTCNMFYFQCNKNVWVAMSRMHYRKKSKRFQADWYAAICGAPKNHNAHETELNASDNNNEFSMKTQLQPLIRV